MIPDDIINQILDRADIAEVISGYIPLKRAGRNFRANCPFHHEKTPSFMISPDKQIFHCFGCGVGGNVFGFVMKYERIEFPEAVELVGTKVGIQIPKSSSGQSQNRSEAAKIHSANEAAVQFYHYTLLETEHAKDAVNYLNKRGVKEETVKKLKLGFAPSGWDSFLSFAKKKGFDAKLLERAGLALAGKDGNFYDRFRQRVIFPIHNNKGQVVGFGARVLDETLPKYMNSPDTPVYSKGRNLYGLNLAIEHIKEKDYVIIVEGYLDFLTPFQAGVGNIVASLGTALTNEQVKLLKRFTNNIVMVFDPDSAGEAASLRGLDVAVAEGMNVKVATLPKGCDPDKFVAQEGVEKFIKCIETAADFFDYKYNLLKSRLKNFDVNSKSKIANEMLITIAKISNAVVKSEYIKRLSQYLDVDTQALWAEASKIRPDQESNFDIHPVVIGAAPKTVNLQAAEKMLLGLILDDPAFITEIKKYYSESQVQLDSDFSVLLGIVCCFWAEHKTINIAKLINSVKNESYCKAILDAYAAVGELVDKEKCLKDCIKNLKQSHVKVKMKMLQAEIKSAQELKKGEQHLGKLLSEYNNLIKQKAEV